MSTVDTIGTVTPPLYCLHIDDSDLEDSPHFAQQQEMTAQQ
jgi:hypothetical protein